MSPPDDVVEDDASIPDDAVLWRRIPWIHWTPVGGTGETRRVSSAAFDGNEMSVEIAAECQGGAEALLHGHDGFGFVAFTAKDARDLGWTVVRDPLENSPAHALVCGNKTHGKRKELVRRCRVERAPQER